MSSCTSCVPSTRIYHSMRGWAEGEPTMVTGDPSGRGSLEVGSRVGCLEIRCRNPPGTTEVQSGVHPWLELSTWIHSWVIMEGWAALCPQPSTQIVGQSGYISLCTDTTQLWKNRLLSTHGESARIVRLIHTQYHAALKKCDPGTGLHRYPPRPAAHGLNQLLYHRSLLQRNIFAQKKARANHLLRQNGCTQKLQQMKENASTVK